MPIIEYPGVRCATCGADPLTPCIDHETGAEVPVHGSRQMVALWRSAVESLVNAAQARRGAQVGDDAVVDAVDDDDDPSEATTATWVFLKTGPKTGAS